MPHSPSPLATLRSLPLRIYNVWSFPPALLLFILHGAVTGCLFPALSLVPLAVSAVHSALLQYPGTRPGSLSSGGVLFTPRSTFAVDALLSFFLLVSIIGSWVSLGSTGYYDTAVVIIGTYCTCFIITTYAIHTLYAGLNLLHVVSANMCDCPECHALRRQDLESGEPLSSPPAPEYQGQE